MSDIFDFGFTAMDDTELEKVQTAVDDANTAQERLDGLYSAIIPLLANLKANPEKDYIYWPNRIAKVEQFEAHIATLAGK